MRERKLISLDWAMKRLLRSKVHFGILEGFLSELLHDDITILEVLESESNQDEASDKYNHSDLKVKNAKGEIVIIEIQFDTEYDYLKRVLYGVSKAITEHIVSGMKYAEVKKVISISILYFQIGSGTDYVYHGTTDFRGVNDKHLLQLSEKERKFLSCQSIPDVFPEYYLLCVNNFNDNAKNTLDEWVYFLKNEEIKPEFHARGIQEASDVLSVLKLTKEERLQYEAYEEKLHKDASQSARINFDIEYAKNEGIAIGEKNAALKIASNLLDTGISEEQVSLITGISIEMLRRARKEKKE